MILLKLDGIDGDCKMPDWTDYISLSAVSWEISREFSESGKMGTKDVNVGTADLPPISLSKSMDRASVFLMQNAIAGSSLGTAEIKFLAQSGTAGAGEVFLEFKLDNAIIAKWSIDASEDDRPAETCELWYHKIWMQYYTTEDGKSYKTAGSRGWDRVENKAWAG